MEFETLHRLCNRIGMRYREANFVLCQLSAFVFSFFFRAFLGPNQVSPGTRHAVQAVCGILMCIQAIGWEIVHLIAMSTVCYLLYNLGSPKTMQKYVSWFSILYLATIHICFIFLGKGVNNFDCIGPLMVLTEKVSCLAWSLHDGLARKESELNSLQQKMVVRRIPSILEYCSFIFYPQGLLIGPVTFYAEYDRFIDGSMFMVREKDSEGKDVLVYKEPSSAIAVTKKILFTILCAIVLLTLVPKYPIMGNVDEDHLANTSFWYKMMYVIVSVEVAKSKYFFGWVWGDAINNAAGMGFNGYDVKGNPRWDGISNINIWKMQFPTSFKVLVDNWNRSALLWLRHTCYDRVPFQRALLTFLLSSVWHGFFPGFFLTFITAHLMMEASKKVRYNVRPFFQNSPESRMFYDVVTWLTTYISVAYLITPFTYLYLGLCIKFFNSIYWWEHILATLVLILLPGKKKTQRKTDTDMNCAKETNGFTENGATVAVNGDGTSKQEIEVEPKKDL